jgi:hypothetical protein
LKDLGGQRGFNLQVTRVLYDFTKLLSSKGLGVGRKTRSTEI